MARNSTRERGLVYDIQRYCLHDGPGIRTVIFFKGCPLQCKWCANPESLESASEIVYNKMDCINCQRCLKVCQHEAIISDGNSIVIDKQKCQYCFDCIKECPTGALSVKGIWYTVDEIIEIVRKDIAFYKNSGGGITLSGGEVLAQSEFASELLKDAKKYNIHTTIETSGYCNWEDFERVLESTDLVLFDIKHINNEIHAWYTGVGNALILENFKKIVDMGKEIVARIPIIPTVNTDSETIEEYISLLKQLKVKSVNVLPFHQLGEAKYEMIGLPYAFKGVKPPSCDLMKSIKQRISDVGIDVKIGG